MGALPELRVENSFAASTFKAFGSHIAISLTSRCPLRCAHCISESGPERDGHVDLSDGALDAFLAELEADDQVASRVKFITLTGGEAALLPDLVRRTITVARRRNIRVGLMTSGYWGKSRDAARRFLERIDGLDSMTLSTDLEHLRFVPLDWVRNAFDVAEEAGVTTHVRLTRAVEPGVAEQELERLLAGEFRERLEVQHFVPWGRAESYAPAQRRDSAAPVILPTLPCPSNGEHILESGHVIPCCNTIVAVPPTHGLVLGRVGEDRYRDIQASAAASPLLLYIRLFGYGPILEALRTAGFDIANDDVSPCHVCAVVLKSPETSAFAAAWAASPMNILHICAALQEMDGGFDFAPITARARSAPAKAEAATA